MNARWIQHRLGGIIVFTLGVLFAAGSAAGQMQMPDMSGGKHQDHTAKHGGQFFMAEDDNHHLEGVFTKPGVFRVYLYDAYTKPLSKDKVKQASGVIQLGDDPDAPKIPLMLSKDRQTLEVSLPQAKFPFTVTLLMHFPGMKADQRPELFTLPFSAYTNPNDHPAASMPANMKGMKM